MIKQVGSIPSNGAHASLIQVKPFTNYFENLITEEITNSIKFIHEKKQKAFGGIMVSLLHLEARIRLNYYN